MLYLTSVLGDALWKIINGMMFQLEGKVALVTGGISGIGLCCVKELLRNGVKGVTIADIDSNLGKVIVPKLEIEFGRKKLMFVKTDVSDINEFEDAFKKTIETFENVDILINNAGIFNGSTWKREIAVNLNGIIHGVILGLENYLQKYKQGSEAIIVNTASTAALYPVPACPIYAAIKAGVASLTRSWGHNEHYERCKVRVFAICPGLTITASSSDLDGKTLGKAYEKLLQTSIYNYPPQGPKHVAQEMLKLMVSSPSGTVWVVEGGKDAYQYIYPSRS